MTAKSMRKDYTAFVVGGDRWQGSLSAFYIWNRGEISHTVSCLAIFASCGQVPMKEYFITLSKLLLLAELHCHISPPHSVLKIEDSGYSYFILNLLVLKVLQIKFSFLFNWAMIMLLNAQQLIIKYVFLFKCNKYLIRCVSFNVESPKNWNRVSPFCLNILPWSSIWEMCFIFIIYHINMCDQNIVSAFYLCWRGRIFDKHLAFAFLK